MVPLDEEMYRWIHGRDEAFRAYAKGFELCARREHSVLQLSRKLYRRGFSRESVADACSRLLSANALDDRRYAHVWTRSQINKKRHSRMFLAAKLAEAGIRQDIVDEALKEEFNPRDEKTALETAADRLFRKPGMTHEKCTQTLLRRGFSYKDIRVVLAEKSHE
ncbi:MAG: RecX family transcriptional regulator [Spirochaetales bacterium]|nr:RecX family transcriptional regulator [Spirochaetales bacterium]